MSINFQRNHECSCREISRLNFEKLTLQSRRINICIDFPVKSTLQRVCAPRKHWYHGKWNSWNYSILPYTICVLERCSAKHFGLLVNNFHDLAGLSAMQSYDGISFELYNISSDQLPNDVAAFKGCNHYEQDQLHGGWCVRVEANKIWRVRKFNDTIRLWMFHY